MRRFSINLFLGTNFYLALVGLVFLYMFGYLYSSWQVVADWAMFGFGLLILFDAILLFATRSTLNARRILADRLSNGDENPVRIVVENGYSFPVGVELIDELPAQFQIRDFLHHFQVKSKANHHIEYTLTPVTRGEYHFGDIRLYASSSIGILKKRFIVKASQMVPVYPSYIQMQRYELLAISNRLTEAGIKKIRRVGHTLEFDQIREYVRGDDFRTINWKATARRNSIMVNHYQDEKSQQVYSVINMGRVMKMPFQNMTLLDYAINSSLVISNIAIRKHDRAGIVTFSDRISSLLPADRRPTQMYKILELLYNQETAFGESDYWRLYATLLQKISQRSLLLLYTNFETLGSMQRQISFLRQIAQRHLLVVIFFKNTELYEILEKPAPTVEAVYRKTIAGQYAHEKQMIVRELQRYGIQSILTTPEQLSVNTINRYLQLKARGLI